MNIKLKSILPSLSCLLVGMLFFFSIRALPIPQAWGNDTVFGLISCAVMFLLSKVLMSYENIKLSDMHLIPISKTVWHLSIGLIIGAVIVGGMLCALFSFTNLAIQRVESQALVPFILASLVFIPLALMEEILFRGYPFFRFSQLINIRWTILITATLFALYHFDGSSSIGSLLIGPGIWGVAFGVAAYVSKSIAVPLGIHISANVLQALFGLKDKYIPMWEVTNANNLATTIEPDQLGIIMQVLVLVFSIVVLEFSIRNKKSNGKRMASLQTKLATNTVLENK